MHRRHTSVLFALVSTALLAGCEGSDTEAVKKAERARFAAESRAAAAEKALAERITVEKRREKGPKNLGAKTVEDARSELQGRIDRFLGGQKDASLLGALFSINAVTTNFDKIEIRNVLQKYDDGGKLLPNEFVANFTAPGSFKFTGAPEAKVFELLVFAFRDGKWEVH